MPLSQLWRTIDLGNIMFDDYQRDWIREDENSPSYDHKLLGEISTNSVYINRFILDSDEVYAAVEIGITNDFESIFIYLNNILLFEEDNHISNNRNYFRLLYSGSVLQTGSNVIAIMIDNQPHLNNVYVYGYPATPKERIFSLLVSSKGCMYVPQYSPLSHSKLVENHDIQRLFDYSSEYFYFDDHTNIFVTIANQFFE